MDTDLNLLIYGLAFKISYLVAIIPTLALVIVAVLSAKEIGGTLGSGVKKVAAGSIVDTALIATYILLQRGYQGVLGDRAVGLFFLVGGLLGSGLLIAGFVQIYKISKKMKLFTM